MHSLDVIVIALYMAVLVGVGVRVSRRQHSTDQYFLAERSIPGWAIGMSPSTRSLSSHSIRYCFIRT